jgi:hypothetical protein
LYSECIKSGKFFKGYITYFFVFIKEEGFKAKRGNSFKFPGISFVKLKINRIIVVIPDKLRVSN